MEKKVWKMNLQEVKYLEVSAGVRYWEDASINGSPDVDGNIPLRKGDNWQPIIELEKGQVLDWPSDIEAKIHYKVCDDGEYWLLNEEKKRIAKWKSYYVPEKFLCVDSYGFGDYIIFEIDKEGKIINWKKPEIDEYYWQEI